MSWACFFLLTTQVNINFGRSKSKTVIFTKIIFAIELEFAKSAKFTARENFALYGTSKSDHTACSGTCKGVSNLPV